MIQTQTVATLLAASEAFDVPLRLGEGFDEQRFAHLCQALRACAQEWAEAEVIPKVAANVLVDLFPAIESCSYLPFYHGEEAQRIRDAAQTLGDLVRECVAIRNGHPPTRA